MVDTFTKDQRSRVMGRIRSKDTKPEMIVRSHLYSNGVRYRLHIKQLPGKPDIVISKIKTAIFVHGCFWHHHKGCRRSNWPKSNQDYWKPKIKNTISRDKYNMCKLQNMGWSALIIWECNTKKISDSIPLKNVVEKYNKSRHLVEYI